MNCDQILLCLVSCGPYGLWDFGLSQTKDDHRRRHVEMSLVVALKRWPYVVPRDGYKDVSCNQRCVRNLG